MGDRHYLRHPVGAVLRLIPGAEMTRLRSWLVTWGTCACIVESADTQGARTLATSRYNAPDDAQVRPATTNDDRYMAQARKRQRRNHGEGLP